MQFLWYIGYFILMLGTLIFLDKLRNKLTERNIVESVADTITWTALLISVQNIWLFMIGGMVGVIINSYFISKLYPTLNTKHFVRRKKNAMQCDVRREEKGSKASIPEDKDRDIAENRR